ncbi:mechanosensitive ion channel protein MscS [Rhodanobacter sp. FW510-R12]|uniref:mechanosensitive ion channel family protein n=1 Tax=unclassified Rhodanobacter TaxID=2621553 RepID=UPI0007A9D3A3|nr:MULTISPECIES: mechanosensitive ion channel domain-containing protein [unclassified Rhodanobacter]KZC17723.1 mechanosensitive ion channel protein MscS [Rhodanobacter sp. FW104-R8]KZC27984.1 mechanosensitive ion channel protein MscS [Rhodanobacter sp. FW510-T8]KZC29913.1 mechanosensitive ion channel protein MscS [Rhodanobacter sp. FW510-R10]
MFDVSVAPAATRAMSAYTDQAVQIGLRLLGALLVLLVGMWVARRLANVVQRALGRASFDSTLSGFLRNLTYGVLVALLLVTALGVLGVPSAPMVAALGTAGLAIGLALQGSLSNLAWGVLLVVFRPFRVGDYVSAGGSEGTVHAINLMHTQLVLPDNREAILPNAKIGGDVIVNYNRLGTRRFEVKLGIAYRDDTDRVMATITQLMVADPRVLKEPAPGVWIESLAVQTVNLVLRGWTRSADNWSTQTDLLHAIKRQIDARRISVPVGPQEVTLVRGAPKAD